MNMFFVGYALTMSLVDVIMANVNVCNVISSVKQIDLDRISSCPTVWAFRSLTTNMGLLRPRNTRHQSYS